MHQWDLSQFDVKNAFLHGELEEDVFMAPPPGYQLHENSSYVCHLKKSLYGLKQSPRAWFENFSSTLISARYSQSEGDHTLFFKHGQDSKLAILIVYVDDIIVTGDDVKENGNLKRHLTSNFDIKSLGQLTYFLGIEVAYSRAGVVLSQHKYILDLLKDIGKLDCKPVSTPVDANVKLQAKQSDKDDPINKTSFQRLIGRLLYLNHSRPDISFDVNSLSQYMSNPRQSHQTAANRILSYLKGTIGTGFLFHAGGDPTVKIFTDSDYASSLDDNRSTSGYCSFLGKSLITWRSKKQREVSLSTAEVDIRALKKGVCEGMWIKDILTDLKLMPQEPIILYSDSQSAITMAKNPVHHDRTKHARIDKHYIKEKINYGLISPEYIPSLQQVADILTKGLARQQFQALTSKLGMINIYAQLEGEC